MMVLSIFFEEAASSASKKVTPVFISSKVFKRVVKLRVNASFKPYLVIITSRDVSKILIWFRLNSRERKTVINSSNAESVI